MWQLAITLAVVLVAHGRAEDEPAAAECECVPYYLCANDTINDDGRSQINKRDTSTDCPNYLDVCCRRPPSEDRVTTKSLPPVIKPFIRKPQTANHRMVCGIRNPQGIGPTISGDEDGQAKFGEFPWMVGVLRVESNNQYVYTCGGSLIHPKVVLTGAHCVAGKEGTHYVIRAGEWDTRYKNETFAHQDVSVDRVLIHEDFKDDNLFNDVALLFLTEPVKQAENIGFACLPVQEFLHVPGTRCFASGWGKDFFGKKSRYQLILKKVELPVVSNEECQTLLRKTRLGKYFKLHDSFMCAGGERDKDTCTGDGGSPLVCPLQNSPNQYIQSGLVAWGIGCGEDQIPGVYANMAVFRNWIDAKMADAQLDDSYYTY